MAISTRSKATLAAIAAAAAIFAAPKEGMVFTPYYDPPGVLTVCEGHTGKDVVKGRRYSLKECKALLSADMLKAVEQVEKCAPNLPENQLIAWSDAVFNMGPTIVCDNHKSTAARLLAAGKHREACEQLPRWDKARVAGVMVALPGLTKRRAAEMKLCLEGLS